MKMKALTGRDNKKLSINLDFLVYVIDYGAYRKVVLNDTAQSVVYVKNRVEDFR